MPRILVTGALGLVGSEAVSLFKEKNWDVVGIDNNGRSDYFDTPRKEGALNVDITEPQEVEPIFKEYGPFDAIIHACAQPSHDYSKEHVLEDFQVNAFGTVYLLEMARKYSPNVVFVHCSTDKIYGEGMEREPTPEYIKIEGLEYSGIREQKSRYHSDLPFTEKTSIKPALSPFGVSKLAADFYVQEYAAQGWLTTGVFRMGCITGKNHEGAEQHGFLAYLTKCIKEGKTYKIYGYKGKQVRDQIHACDLVSAFARFIDKPNSGSVYNIGGGPERSVSVLEAAELIKEKTGGQFHYQLIDEPRFADRCWDVHDVSKFRKDYPEWDYKYSLDDIIEDLCAS